MGSETCLKVNVILSSGLQLIGTIAAEGHVKFYMA